MQASLAYRAGIISNILYEGIAAAAIMILWVAIFRDQSKIGPYNFQTLLIYFLFMPFVGGLTSASLSEWFGDNIRTGFFSNQLIKPYKIWITAFMREFAFKIQYVFAIGPIYVFIAIGMLMYFNSLVFSLTGVIFALLFSLLGFIFHIIFDMSLTWLAFWTTEIWWFKHLKKILFSVFGGRRFPIDFFSGNLLFVAEIMPFKFIYFVPLSYFLGIRKPQMFFNDCVNIIFWSLFFGLLGIFLWKKGLKKYEAYGN